MKGTLQSFWPLVALWSNVLGMILLRAKMSMHVYMDDTIHNTANGFTQFNSTGDGNVQVTKL